MSDNLAYSQELQSDHTTALPKSKKTRNRRPKACQPCRARKVRCDYGEPCTTCRKRRHPQICIYADLSEPQRKRVTNPEDASKSTETPHGHTGPSHSGRRTTEVTGQPSSEEILPDHSRTYPSDASLIELLDYIAEHISDLTERDEETGETLHFGRNSAPAFFKCLLSTAKDELLPRGISIGSAYGLTNRTPLHPFGSLWAATAKVTLGDILGSLPSTERCMRYYRAYQQIALPFSPYLVNTDEFERELFNVMQLLGDQSDDSVRSKAAVEMPYEEIGWYALLFAVLASGCQFADDVSSERVLTTRVFVACSFECLRLANFYVQPLPLSAQTTLILEYVVCNDSNPGVAWTFLAISARQAESRGLHVLVPRDGNSESNYKHVHPLWQAVIHMDSILAFAFDRRLLSFLPAGYDIFQNLEDLRKIEFMDLSNALSMLRLQWHTTRTDSTKHTHAEDVRSCIAQVERIQRLTESEASTLKSSGSLQSRLEQLVLAVQIGHFETELCRAGSIARDATPEQRQHWFHTMEQNCVAVLEAFLALKPLSPIANSWDLTFCGSSMALLLAGLQSVRKHQRHTPLLLLFEKSLAPTSNRSFESNDNCTEAIRGVVRTSLGQCEMVDVGDGAVAENAL